MQESEGHGGGRSEKEVEEEEGKGYRGKKQKAAFYLLYQVINMLGSISAKMIYRWDHSEISCWGLKWRNAHSWDCSYQFFLFYIVCMFT